MNIATLIFAVAAFGLPCTNPELRDYPLEELPWPAAYIRTIEGQNIILLREATRNDIQHLRRILVHELLHCGLYEDRERRRQPHPRSLDPREEMAVQTMTDVVLKRLDGNGHAEAALSPLDETRVAAAMRYLQTAGIRAVWELRHASLESSTGPVPEEFTRPACYQLVRREGRMIAWARWEEGHSLERTQAGSFAAGTPDWMVRMVETWIADAYSWQV